MSEAMRNTAYRMRFEEEQMNTEKAEAEAMILILKGALSDLPEDVQVQYRAALVEVKEIVAKYGDAGHMALTMATLEYAAE